MSLPTHGEAYHQLIEHLRLGQEAASMLAHLRRAEGDAKGRMLADGWLAVSEGLKRMQSVVITIASGRLN